MPVGDRKAQKKILLNNCLMKHVTQGQGKERGLFLIKVSLSIIDKFSIDYVTLLFRLVHNICYIKFKLR